MKFLIGDMIMTPQGMSEITDVWYNKDTADISYQTLNSCIVEEANIDLSTVILCADDLL